MWFGFRGPDPNGGMAQKLYLIVSPARPHMSITDIIFYWCSS